MVILVGLGSGLGVGLYLWMHQSCPVHVAPFVFFGFLCSLVFLGVLFARSTKKWPLVRIYEFAQILYLATVVPLVLAAENWIFNDNEIGPILLQWIVVFMLATIVAALQQILVHVSFSREEIEDLQQQLYGCKSHGTGAAQA